MKTKHILKMTQSCVTSFCGLDTTDGYLWYSPNWNYQAPCEDCMRVRQVLNKLEGRPVTGEFTTVIKK